MLTSHFHFIAYPSYHKKKEYYAFLKQLRKNPAIKFAIIRKNRYF